MTNRTHCKKSDKVTVVFFTNTRRYVQRKIIDLHVKLKPESSLLQEVNRLQKSQDNILARCVTFLQCNNTNNNNINNNIQSSNTLD